MRQDAARQLRETTLDATKTPSEALQNHIAVWAPILRELFPCWLEKVDDYSVRYNVPKELSWVFARWAGLQLRLMQFDLPPKWQFGEYTLEQFRSFWKSLLAASIAHSFAHLLGDRAAGTTGLMSGSVVMQVSAEELQTISNKFPLPLEVRNSIIRDLSYDGLSSALMKTLS